MPCESLDGLSRNWDPLKGTQRLPHVDRPSRGVTNCLLEIDPSDMGSILSGSNSFQKSFNLGIDPWGMEIDH